MPSTFDLAPPPKVVDGFLAVPIDIAHIDAKLRLDPATGTGTGDATVTFAVGPTGGRRRAFRDPDGHFLELVAFD